MLADLGAHTPWSSSVRFFAINIRQSLILDLVSSWGSMLQPVLEGFNGVDPFQLCHPDTLHQTELGDQQRLVDGLMSILPPAAGAQLNGRLLGIRHPGLHLPQRGLSAGMVPAYQQTAAFKCLPVALLAFPHQHAAAFMNVAVSTSPKPKLKFSTQNFESQGSVIVYCISLFLVL